MNLSVHIDGLLVQNLPGPGHPLRAGGQTRPEGLQQQRLAAHRRAEVREGDAPVPETRGLHIFIKLKLKYLSRSIFLMVISTRSRTPSPTSPYSSRS